MGDLRPATKHGADTVALSFASSIAIGENDIVFEGPCCTKGINSMNFITVLVIGFDRSWERPVGW